MTTAASSVKSAQSKSSSGALRANQPQEDMNEVIDWLDMSMYGIYLGIIKMPGEDRRNLMLIDESGSNEKFARALGFKRSQLENVWFNESLRFTVPGDMKREYPQMRRVRITRAQRWKLFTNKLVENKVRVKQSGSGVQPGWRPDQKVSAHALAPSPAPLSVAINQTLYCGLNALGQEVFEISDGTRYLRADNTIIARETSEVKGGPEFLRARSAGDIASLSSIAQGLINEMMRSKLRSADFARYLDAAMGADSSKNEARIIAFQNALDMAIFDRLARHAAESSEDDLLQLSRALHEMRPPFFRPEGTYPTPAPIAAIMQSIVMARTRADREAGEAISLIDVSAGEVSQHSWMITDAQVKRVAYPDVGVHHDCLIGGIFGHEILETEIEGLLVNRADHLAIMRSLAHRSDDGFSLLTISADEEAGALNAASKRLIAWLGERYEIFGLTDLDPSMIGEGVRSASRIIGVGKKRPERLHAFAVPAKLPVLFDYEELTSWAKDLVGDDFRSIESFGERRQANRLQAPYIPHSQVSEPVSMSPRNLLGPTRKALSRLVEDEGLNVDDFVMRKLGLDPEVLASGILNAEQIDAIALGIRAIDNNAAFVVADQAGLGKGRVLAALAAYAVKSGRKAMFMTEKSELFADFYRDVRDIGMEGVLDRPFLMNTSGGVNGMDGDTVLFPPSSQAEVLEVCRTGQVPGDRPFMLATYSIFNREALSEDDFDTMGKLDEAIEAILTGVDFDDIPYGRRLMRIGVKSSSFYKKCMEDEQRLVGDALIGRLKDIANYKIEEVPVENRLYSHDDIEYARRELRLRKLKPKQLVRELESEHKKPLNAWRAYWAHHTDALNDVVLLLDESHNAAGMTSQTGDNVRAMTEKAASAIFSSATFTKDERNLPLYSRVFPDSVNPMEIARIVSNGGEPLREILTGMLAEDGLMIRREHDMGNISFRPAPDVKNEELNRFRKDAVANVLMKMAVLAGEVKDLVNTQNKANKQSAKSFTFSYSGPFSRFYSISRAFSVAIGAEHCANLAIEVLKDNKKPVLTIESTMESIIKDMIEMDDKTEESDGRIRLGRNLSFKDLLHRYATNMFNVYQVVRNGRKIVSKKLVSMAPKGMENKVKEIHDEIDKLPVNIPISPIDVMREKIEAAGYSFGEVSGRKIRLSTDEEGVQYVEKIEDTSKGASIRTVSSFNAGETDVLLLSRSGNSGISAQSSALFADTRQRILIEAQPASDIRERVQFFGRVFRTGQVCPPEYILPSSGLSHDRRLTMIQNTSSRRMSASVSGNSENMMIDDNVPEIMNHVGNEVCYYWLENRPDIAALMNIVLPSKDEMEGLDDDEADMSDEEVAQQIGTSNIFCGTDFVDKLTGRLFMLSSDEEERAWKEIHAEYRALIEKYEADGYNPLKSSERDVRARKLASIIFESDQSAKVSDSAFNRPVIATEIEYIENLRSMDPEAIMNEIKKNKEDLKNSGHRSIRALSEAIDIELKTKMDAMAKLIGFSSRQEALAVAGSNRVKRMRSRVRHLDSMLEHMRDIGEVIFLGKDMSPQVVMNIIPPKDPVHLLVSSMWSVRLLDVDSRMIREVSFASLPAEVGLSYRDLKDVLKEVAKAETVTHRRVVLEGNLFMASQICDRMKRGEPVSYSDERGIWHQAFMMPEDMNLEDVKSMDIQVRDADLGAEIVELERYCTLSNSFMMKDRIYSLEKFEYKGQMCISLEFYKTPSKTKSSIKNAFMRDEVLRTLSIDGKTVGSGGVRSFKFPLENTKAVVERMIQIGEAAGAPVLAKSALRGWIEERRVRKLEAANQHASTHASIVADLGL